MRFHNACHLVHMSIYEYRTFESGCQIFLGLSWTTNGTGVDKSRSYENSQDAGQREKSQSRPAGPRCL